MHAPVKYDQPVKHYLEEYQVVQCYDSSSLSTQVTRMLNDGWKLHGNLCVYVNTGGTNCYAQALIRCSKGSR
jgi:hypothetical protein